MKLQWLLIIILFWSCGSDPLFPEEFDNLGSYVAENPDFPLVTDSLIACALGGENILLTSSSLPISILFYPKENSARFLYFETDSLNVDPMGLSNYNRLDLEDQAIFNGYLRKFEREAILTEKWGIVAYLRNGEIHISNPIRIKYPEKPTEDNPSLLAIDYDQPLSPLFTWQEGEIAENKIYFHVVLDSEGSLVSGTYSFDRKFQFYDLSNVVLNIRDINPPPVLNAGQTYSFVLMGVSEDNWVNLILKEEFIAE